MLIFMTNMELPQNLSNRGVQNKYVNKYYVMHALKKSLQQKKSEKPVLLTKSGATGFQIRCHWNFQATPSKKHTSSKILH